MKDVLETYIKEEILNGDGVRSCTDTLNLSQFRPKVLPVLSRPGKNEYSPFPVVPVRPRRWRWLLYPLEHVPLGCRFSNHRLRLVRAFLAPERIHIVNRVQHKAKVG